MEVIIISYTTILPPAGVTLDFVPTTLPSATQHPTLTSDQTLSFSTKLANDRPGPSGTLCLSEMSARHQSTETSSDTKRHL
jgi:hypothetical protein